MVDVVGVHDVAGDGPERPALEELAARQAPGLIRFHGRLPRPELQAMVREATLSVVPSRWYENQPLAVLESYAVGVPVLATDLGGLPELVDDTTGWVVPAEQPEAMGRALAAALADPAEARVRGTQARRLAEERHEPKAHHAAIAAIYEEAGVSS